MSLLDGITVSFDCARRSMGVAVVSVLDYDTRPGSDQPVDRGDTAEWLRKMTDWIERQIHNLSFMYDNIIKIWRSEVWDLGVDISQAWEVAPVLRTRVEALDAQYNGHICNMVYEFQMSANDKTRMISAMLVYNYARKHIVRVSPAEKNKITIARGVTRDLFETACPVISSRRIVRRGTVASALYSKHEVIDLSIQSFLRIYEDPYRANKTHTAAMLEWWCYVFNCREVIENVPNECLDDAADAFIQVLAVLRRGRDHLHPHLHC